MLLLQQVLFLAFASVLTSIFQLVNAGDASNITRKYAPQSYAVYKPAMNFMTDGALEIWFKTEQKDAMIFYQDTGGQGEFIDVFLVEGKARMRISIGECSITYRFINGSFNDRKWHKVKIVHSSGNTTFCVDNLRSSPARCLTQLQAMVALYTGELSIEVRNILIQENEWGLPSVYYDSGFQGCISEIKYIIAGKVTIPKLYRTKNTVDDCTNPCDKFRCRNGGKCVDKILKPWCDCEGTGHEGKRCGRATPKNRSSLSKLFTSLPSTMFSTVRPNLRIPMTSSITSSSSNEGSAKHARKQSSGITHGGSLFLVTVATVLSHLVVSSFQSD